MSELSFIEKLLDGAEVEWVKLGDVAEVGTGKSNRQDESENGEYPFYVRSQNILKSDTFQFDETSIVVPGEGGIGDVFHFVQGKYALHQRAYRIHITTDTIKTKFLFHYMRNSFKQYIVMKSVGATSISIRKPMLEQFQIPIPPLPVQEELVRILDTFTELTAKLRAELTTREKQYSYYRDLLFSEEELSKVGFEWRDLAEVAKIKHGKDWKALSEGDIPVYGTGGIMTYVDSFVYDKPTVLIPRKGSLNNIFYLESPFWNVDTIFYTEIDESKIIPKYFYYFVTTIDFMTLETGSGRPSLTQAILNRIKIPIPPLAEQACIVAILDKFDTLTHSIKEGLPREIELRQKQYEYYRDLLLSFKHD